MVSMGWIWVLLNKVFVHFEIKLGRGISGTIKQAFSLTTLVQCECLEGRTRNKAKFQVSDLLDQQKKLKQQVEEMIVAIATRDVEIVRLKAQIAQGLLEAPSSEDILRLKADNDMLTVEVKTLT